MRDDNSPIDLSERKDRRKDRIPLNGAVAAFIILLAAGVFIGAILPSISMEEVEEEKESRENGIDLLLLCTVDHLETDELSYENLPLTTAFELLMLEQLDGEGTQPVDVHLMDYIPFIFNGTFAYRLKVSPGQGWENVEQDLVFSWGDPVGNPETFSKEAFTSGSGSGKSVFISLDIYREAEK